MEASIMGQTAWILWVAFTLALGIVTYLIVYIDTWAYPESPDPRPPLAEEESELEPERLKPIVIPPSVLRSPKLHDGPASLSSFDGGWGLSRVRFWRRRKERVYPPIGGTPSAEQATLPIDQHPLRKEGEYDPDKDG
jgi:hypothetical protein